MSQEVSPLWGPAGVPVNAGAGPHFDVLEIGHEDFVALINADTAFWVLAPRDQALEYLLGAELPRMFLEKEARLASDLNNVRFGLLPSAVYFNPTERCNLDCGYCYLPREARRSRRPHGPGPPHGVPGDLAGFLQEHPARGGPAPTGVPRRRTPAGQGRGLCRDRKVWRLLPLRGPDQRHPAGPGGQRLPGGPWRGHRAVPGRPHRRGGRPHPAHLGRRPGSSPKPSRPWRIWSIIPG